MEYIYTTSRLQAHKYHKYASKFWSMCAYSYFQDLANAALHVSASWRTKSFRFNNRVIVCMCLALPI